MEIETTGNILPLQLETDELSSQPAPAAFVFRSEPMRKLYALAVQVAGSDAPVLISGESGTGKEIFARLIHLHSPRSVRPFIPVNCGVLRGELFADKFFGHEAGAFTGASRLQKGSFELAGEGTLFLDEVGEIPLTNQVDFLRVLEQRNFKRLGGERDLPFAARIVAATNRELPRMLASGDFRADLYYRLNVVPVTIPPLRERAEDIELLASYFLDSFKVRYHKPELSLDPEVMLAFSGYSWPGNVRELKNLVERLVLLSQSESIGVEDLPLDLRLGSECQPRFEAPEGLSLAAAVKAAEIKAIFRAFAASRKNKGKTAEMLGISPRTLRYKCAEYGLEL